MGLWPPIRGFLGNLVTHGKRHVRQTAFSRLADSLGVLIATIAELRFEVQGVVYRG